MVRASTLFHSEDPGFDPKAGQGEGQFFFFFFFLISESSLV